MPLQNKGFIMKDVPNDNLNIQKIAGFFADTFNKKGANVSTTFGGHSDVNIIEMVSDKNLNNLLHSELVENVAAAANQRLIKAAEIAKQADPSKDIKPGKVTVFLKEEPTIHKKKEGSEEYEEINLEDKYKESVKYKEEKGKTAPYRVVKIECSNSEALTTALDVLRSSPLFKDYEKTITEKAKATELLGEYLKQKIGKLLKVKHVESAVNLVFAPVEKDHTLNVGGKNKFDTMIGIRLSNGFAEQEAGIKKYLTENFRNDSGIKSNVGTGKDLLPGNKFHVDVFIKAADAIDALENLKQNDKLGYLKAEKALSNSAKHAVS